MARESIADRYDRLVSRGESLVAHATPPSPVHVQTVQVLSEMLGMGTRFSTAAVPTPLRVMMRTLQKMEPVLIEELASVPPEAIQQFLGELVAKMQTIIDSPTTEVTGANGPHDAQPTAQPRVDLASTA